MNVKEMIQLNTDQQFIQIDFSSELDFKTLWPHFEVFISSILKDNCEIMKHIGK